MAGYKQEYGDNEYHNTLANNQPYCDTGIISHTLIIASLPLISGGGVVLLLKVQWQ